MGGPLDHKAFADASDAAATQGNDPVDRPCVPCTSDNWVKLRYEYADGTGVPGAAYVVQTVTDAGTPTGEVLAEGVTDADGNAVAALPDGHDQVEFYFHADPEGDPYEDPDAARPLEEPEEGFWKSLWDNITDGADWIWGVLKGDFEEDPSTSQIIGRMILTMIPGIDQLADVQDITNILYRLIWKQEWEEKMHWVLLVITLIGLIPVLGSLAKGLLKLVIKKAGDLSALRALYGVFNYFRKGNAHRWIRDFATDLTGKHLAEALRLLMEMMNRVIRYMEDAKGWLSWRWNALLDQGIAKVRAFMGTAPAKMQEAAAYLQKQIVDTLRQGMSRIQRRSTKNPDPHVVKQEQVVPSARFSRSEQEYEDLAKDPAKGGKIDAGSEAEREVGLGLEERGEVPGPITRDPTGGAEFIDANGVEWDVKAYNSNFPNGFQPERIEQQLEMSRRLGENIMLDTRNLSSADLSKLREIVDAKDMGENVRFWP